MPAKAECHDCGWEKRFRDHGTGVSPEESAKAAKAGHVGGQSQHYSTDETCSDVEVTTWGDND